ncbi:hydrogenase-4 component G [Arcobacter sp. s6]|uniref:hydrogenase-4 component G n=1 Tax=Arcobacter sp. s6 TaxID=3230363 RepID=UPI0034A0469F
MDIQGSTNTLSNALNTFTQNSTVKSENIEVEKSLEEIINDSAVKVSISMNAQSILFAMNSELITKDNLITQASLTSNEKDVLDFLSGNESQSGMNLENIGYTGKAITELTQDEAKELVSDEGFFGVTQTSDRVSNFVFNFAGDNLEILEKGREGIVKGFQEAEKLFGGELPEISYKTQERTLALIDEKINSLKENS